MERAQSQLFATQKVVGYAVYSHHAPPYARGLWVCPPRVSGSYVVRIRILTVVHALCHVARRESV